jgi:hypothetical protein
MRVQTKAVRRKMKELLVLAHEAALRKELQALAARVEAWQRGEIDSFQITEEIHQFHHGPARKLYNYYCSQPAGFVEMKIAGAVVDGLIPRDKIPAEAAEYIEGCMAMIQNHRGPAEE